jgi:hypothetical protein
LWNFDCYFSLFLLSSFVSDFHLISENKTLKKKKKGLLRLLVTFLRLFLVNRRRALTSRPQPSASLQDSGGLSHAQAAVPLVVADDPLHVSTSISQAPPPLAHPVPSATISSTVECEECFLRGSDSEGKKCFFCLFEKKKKKKKKKKCVVKVQGVSRLPKKKKNSM